MYKTKHFFFWLSLAIFSTAFISCTDNSAEDTQIIKPENVPGTITFTEGIDNKYITKGLAIVKYLPSQNKIIIETDAVIKEDVDSIKTDQFLKITVYNVEKLKDLDGKTLDVTEVTAAGDPKTYIKVSHTATDSNTKEEKYKNTSVTAKLKIDKIGGGELEGSFEAALESGIAPKIVRTKITEGVIHRVPVTF